MDEQHGRKLTTILLPVRIIQEGTRLFCGAKISLGLWRGMTGCPSSDAEGNGMLSDEGSCAIP